MTSTPVLPSDSGPERSPAAASASAPVRETEVRPDDQAFVIELPEFSGPLDLLMTLIREEQVDVTDIPIARIAEQFLLRIRHIGLNEAADYLEMAARLLRIKAQLLLPRPEGEDWEDPRAELVRRLLEYQQIREVVDVLERLADDRRGRYERAFFPEPDASDAPVELALSLPQLLSALDRIVRGAQHPGIHDVIPRALDVEGAIVAIRAALARHHQPRWHELLGAGAEPWQILSLLLALLELARRGELRIVQHRPFAPPEISGDAASEAA